MKIEESAAFRDRLASELAKLDISYAGTSATYGGYHESAAVLVRFDPTKLRPSGLAAPEESIEQLLANCTLEPGANGSNAWSLESEVRIAVLRQLGTRERMLEALAANTDRPDVIAQQMLEAYLRGTAPPLEQQTLSQLSGSFQVARWLQPVLGDVPATDRVAARIEFASLLKPFYELGGVHFSGRKPELERLRHYVGVIPVESSPAESQQWLDEGVEEVENLNEKPPLMIYGPGGTGKSSLLSRFILDHATLDDQRRIPFIYLDFDRPELRADEPVTLLIEAVRQLGLQYPHARAACESIRADWQTQLAEAARQRPATTSSTASSLDATSFILSFRTLLRSLDLSRKPILWVLDTFEEVQWRSPGGVRQVMTFLAELQSNVPRLRTVIAGRAPIADENTDELLLGDLDVEASQAYLQKKGVSDPEVARSVAQQLGGNPLTLRLAAEIVEKDGVGALEQRSGLDQLSVQRQLFRRILGRIHDPAVRQLAHPGLVLRRITPSLIKDVLAGPCDMQVPDMATAERLFAELKREISIVAPSDAQSVRHRPELRRIMLPLLERDRGETVDEIHRLAIGYYSTRHDVVSRAEEIYHRLSLEEPSPVVDARWIPGVEPHLASALEDLKPMQRAYLASRLGVETDVDTRAAASLIDWERDAERRMRDWLAHDDPRQALAVFAERSDRRPGTVLDSLAATAYERVGEADAAVSVLEAVLANVPRDAPSGLQADLLLQLARFRIQAGDAPAAGEALDRAAALDVANAALHQARVLALRLRIHQASDSTSTGSDLDALRQCLATIDDQQLRADPALLREIAPVLGADDGELLARFIRLLGFETITRPQRQSLSVALAAWDAELSKGAGQEPGMLARSLGLEHLDRLSETWAMDFRRRRPADIAKVTSELLETHSLASASRPVAVALRDAIVAALGAEVRPAGGQRPAGGERAAPTPPPQVRRITRDIRLTGPQVRELQRALVDAFPDVAQLEAMLRFRLEKTLNAITLGKDLAQSTFDVVVTAQAEGWTADLLVAALNAAPSNPQLQAIAQQVGIGSAAPQAQELEKLVRASAEFFDINQFRSRLGAIEAQVCRIELQSKSGTGWATGFLVAPDIVMTVFHVLERVIGQENAPDLVCRFDYRKLPDGRTYPGTEARLSTRDWLIDYSPYHPSDAQVARDRSDIPVPDEDHLDYALLRLDSYLGAEPIGGGSGEVAAARRGWIEVPRSGRPLEPGSPIFILQHPQGEPLKLSIEMNGIVGLNPAGTRVWYNANTEPGSAGAPCFSQDWELIAIHHSRRTQSGLKEGVPLDAIVRRLEHRGVYEVLGGRGFA